MKHREKMARAKTVAMTIIVLLATALVIQQAMDVPTSTAAHDQPVILADVVSVDPSMSLSQLHQQLAKTICEGRIEEACRLFIAPEDYAAVFGTDDCQSHYADLAKVYRKRVVQLSIELQGGTLTRVAGASLLEIPAHHSLGPTTIVAGEEHLRLVVRVGNLEKVLPIQKTVRIGDTWRVLSVGE